MENDPIVRFTMAGRRFELRRSQVESVMHQVPAEPVRSHGVEIGGTWYPVKQAMERYNIPGTVAISLGPAEEQLISRPYLVRAGLFRDADIAILLARVKLEYDARRWMRPELTEVAGECRMGALTLYRSILKEEGASYEVLGRWTFDVPALD